MRIDKPGVYDMSAADYHADPAPVPSLSASIAKILIEKTPQHAFVEHPRLNPDFEREEADKFNIGNAAHSLILGDTKDFVVCQFDDWRKKETQAQRDAAHADGKIPLLASQWDRVRNMVSAGRMQLDGHQDAADAFTKGKPEQTLIWKEGDTWLRARLDWLPDDRDAIYYDYKTSETADPGVWQRIAFAIGHDVQAAFYRRGIRALGLNENPRFRFIVQETQIPFALSSIELDQEALELADYKLNRALDRWRWCMMAGQWPAYPATTALMSPPSWHEQQYLEREEREAGMARSAGVPSQELLALSLKYQGPL